MSISAIPELESQPENSNVDLSIVNDEKLYLLGSSLAAGAAAAAAGAAEAAPPPDGIEDNLVDPSAIKASTDLPLNSLMTFSALALSA